MLPDQSPNSLLAETPSQCLFFFSSKKLFLVLRYSNCYLHFIGHVKERLDKKAKVNFKLYDVTKWETINCNTQAIIQ